MSSHLTKKAIIEAFIDLLNKYPLDQITVTDITKQCGISRRTFYNYYQDIYQLPEELFLEETRRILKGKIDFASWEDWFLTLMEFAYKNKKAISHVYNSVRREYLERYIYSIADKTITDYIAKQAENTGCRPEDIDKLAEFYTCGFVGMAMNWIGSGMNEDPEIATRKLVDLLQGTIQYALENCWKMNSDENAQN